MGSENENWDKEWTGLEPKQRRSSSWGCWLGAIALFLLMVTICGIGGYVAWQQFDLAMGPGLVLVPPTALTNGTIDVGTPQAVSPEAPALAATVTLPAANSGADVAAGRLVTAVVIDGDLGEWGDVPVTEANALVYSAAGWDGSDDVRGLWRLGWDDNYLFIAVQVEDDLHIQTQTGNQIFRGDSVSLQIDSDLDGDFGPQLSEDDYQINLSPGDFAGIPPSAFRFQGTREGGMVDAPGHGIRVAALQVEAGYQLEAAIPWQDIGLAPEAGLVVGLALNVNDNDTVGTAVQEVMKSHAATRAFRDPSSWGRLTLR